MIGRRQLDELAEPVEAFLVVADLVGELEIMIS